MTKQSVEADEPRQQNNGGETCQRGCWSLVFFL